MKFDVTFKFENCTPTVTVEADTWMQAIAKARARDYPPVPDDVPATAEYAGPGGKREGSGVKKGSIRTSDPRNIKKQIRWTAEEWKSIEDAAETAGISVALYQRNMILMGGPHG